MSFLNWNQTLYFRTCGDYFSNVYFLIRLIVIDTLIYILIMIFITAPKMLFTIMTTGHQNVSLLQLHYLKKSDYYYDYDCNVIDQKS